MPEIQIIEDLFFSPTFFQPPYELILFAEAKPHIGRGSGRKRPKNFRGLGWIQKLI